MYLDESGHFCIRDVFLVLAEAIAGSYHLEDGEDGCRDLHRL